MRNFILFLDLNNHQVPIGSSNTSEFKSFSTYEEVLNEGENDQYTLTFSVVAKSYTEEQIQWNPLLSFYHIGAKMRLLIDDHKRIDLIISNIAPQTKEMNTIWNITAQDEVSYSWSKQHVTQVYSTTDGNTSSLKPKNIYDICDDLIAQNWLEPWKTSRFVRDPELSEKTITLDNIQNNPYQILIEACNTVGASISIDYSNHTIDFYRKTLVRHSGYRYHPARNLVDFDSNYSGEETTTWLHVHGGADANGIEVTIIPTLPAPIHNYIHNQIEANALDNITWDAINDTIGYNPEEDNIDATVLEGLVNDNISYELVHIRSAVISNLGTYQENDSSVISLNTFGQDLQTKTNYLELKFIFNSEPAYIRIKIDKLQDRNTTGEQDGVIIFDQNDILTQSGFDQTITSVSVYRETEELNFYKLDYTKTLEQQLLEFGRIGKQIPYLGQYLIDFTPFKSFMSIDEWSALNSLINNTLFHYNLKLQYYSFEYYSNLIGLTESRDYLAKVLGEAYLAACFAYIQADGTTEQADLENDIKKYKAEIYNYIKESSYLSFMQNLGYSEELEIDGSGTLYWENLINKQEDLIKQFIITQNDIRKSGSDQNGTIEYYNKLIQQSTALITDNILDGYSINAPGLYKLIIDCLREQIKPADIPLEGVAYHIQQTKTDIAIKVFRTLYSKYGKYLYENTYENLDELDSSSLYNQAITYFADLNRIQSSHSLTVLDIGSLDAISVPRLSVGSVISVYNPNTPAMQPYAPLLEKVEIAKHKYESLKSWLTYIEDYNLHNSLINQAYQDYIDATNMVLNKYKLNNPEQNINNFTELENLLYQDTLLVTGIKRVLREPLRDSVTVEQSSRYKSILAKLIKSI